MKKNVKIILGVLLVIILLVVCSKITPREEEDDELTSIQSQSESITDEEQKELTQIDVASYIEKYKDSAKHIVFIGRDTCNYCRVEKPILQKVAKDYDLEIFYVNTDTVLTEEERDMFINSNEYFESVEVPLLVIVGEEKLQAVLDDLANYEQYVEFFKENKMIEGE